MPTATNTTVNCYKSVPLVKGGTEVLYLSGAAAAGVLAAYLSQTYTQYYYTRENRGYIQVDAPIEDLEGCNYVGFQNVSHGGKWFFGFIDQLVYINDNNTQIEFTIDPFPTYLGDCTKSTSCYILRNTPDSESRQRNMTVDIQPKTPRKGYTNLYSFTVTLDAEKCYYAVGPGATPAAYLGNTGIGIGALTTANIEAINENGGVIIGAYMVPNAWVSGGNNAVSRSVGVMTCNPLAWAAGQTYKKLQTGVYNTLILSTPAGCKSYDIELFGNPENVSFACVGVLMPAPALFVYPLSYNGVANNISEGVYIDFPSLPIAAAPVYSRAEQFSDAATGIKAIAGSVISNALLGNPLGAIPESIQAGFSAFANANYNEIKSQFDPPTLSGSGTPCVNTNREITVELICAHPATDDVRSLVDYFDYYGYQQNRFMGSATNYPIEEKDGAFLQTGDVYLSGSERDVELNARLMAGIKIRKTL